MMMGVLVKLAGSVPAAMPASGGGAGCGATPVAYPSSGPKNASISRHFCVAHAAASAARTSVSAVQASNTSLCHLTPAWRSLPP